MEAIAKNLDNLVRVYAFDQLLLLPGLGNLQPSEIDTYVSIGDIGLSAPLISSPMDTVTESSLAAALALRGGLGVIHRNCTISEAVEMIRKVKATQIPEGNTVAARDADGKLAVAAAVSPLDLDRAMELSKEADLLFTDVASFHNSRLMEGTKKIIEATGKRIVVGNFGTAEGVLDAVKELGKENIAAVKVGLGGGSICITTDVTGVGSPATFASQQAASALKSLNLLDKIPIIADGGIRSSRDIAIAFAMGASLVILGKIFSGCEESAGETVVKGGKRWKTYWGMGSSEARKKRMVLDRYQDYAKGKQVDEGIKSYVPLNGTVSETVDRLMSELRVTMGYIGAESIQEIPNKARMVVRTAQG